ncbi:MAG: hypothetical protein ACTSYA_11040 [Candidatus Kariarchaeaceae archaeon]
MTKEVVSADEEIYNPSFIYDFARIFQIVFIIVIVGAIASYLIDDDFSSRSVYDTTMAICLIICVITSVMIGGQICGSSSFAGNRQLLFAMGHKQRLRTYNRELLRRGHLGHVGVIWIASFMLLAVAFSRWIMSGEI